MGLSRIEEYMLSENVREKIQGVSKPISQTFTATNGQTVFNLSNSYELGKNLVAVEIGGVTQNLGEGFTETSTTSITLSEGVPLGTKVKVIIYSTYVAVDSRINDFGLQLADIAKVIQTENQLISAINENIPMVLSIGRNIVITTNLAIPRNIRLIFRENGKFSINSGVTLTLNGVIDAGFYQIFSFADATAKVTATKVSYGHSIGADYPLNGGYTVKPDWFGAIPDGRPVNAYNSIGSYAPPIGTDNTAAFKRCMKFAEDLSNYLYRDVYANVPSVVVALRPSSGYIVKGDNPLGVQSTDNAASYQIELDGNRSVILWEPSAQNNVLFKKYGRIKYPRIENLKVLLCTDTTNRWGTFIASKTGEGDASHTWTQGVFRNILLGTPYGRAGFNIIFDIDVDGAHTMDDQTHVENVQCTTYNTYLRLANNEAVDWKISKVMFASGTDNAIHIDIKDNFSGGLTLDSCEILMQQTGETFIKLGTGIASTPVRIINGRFESRNTNAWTFVDVQSGKVICNNLNFLGGNSVNIPNAATRTAKIGLTGLVEFDNCTLYDNIDLTVGTTHSASTAAIFSSCSFYGAVSGAARTFGYPSIRYIDSSTSLEVSLPDAIKAGKSLRRVAVNHPRATDGGLGLPVILGNSVSNQKEFVYEISKPKSDGSPCVNFTSNVSLPPNIIITAVRLYATGINTTNVDQIRFYFFADDGSGATKEFVWKDFADNTDVNGTNMMPTNTIITLPFRPFFSVEHRKSGVAVTNESLMPTAWVELSYKAITKRQDIGANNAIPTKKLILATL